MRGFGRRSQVPALGFGTSACGDIGGRTGRCSTSRSTRARSRSRDNPRGSFSRSTSVYEEDGTGYWQGVWLDVTDRHVADEARKEAEERYRSLVETLPAVVYIDRLDEISTNIYMSPQVEQMLGYTAEQFHADPEL